MHVNVLESIVDYSGRIVCPLIQHPIEDVSDVAWHYVRGVSVYRFTGFIDNEFLVIPPDVIHPEWGIEQIVFEFIGCWSTIFLK